jgi:hypothetical protein
MSLTISEANAINTLLSALIGTSYPGSDLGLPPGEDQVGEAATLLATRAHRTIMAGWDGPAAALAVEQAYAGKPAATVETVYDFQRQAAASIVNRLDGDEIALDGLGWASDAPDEDDIADELILTHPSGRQVLVRVSVELIEGALS